VLYKNYIKLFRYRTVISIFCTQTSWDSKISLDEIKWWIWKFRL